MLILYLTLASTLNYTEAINCLQKYGDSHVDINEPKIREHLNLPVNDTLNNVTLQLMQQYMHKPIRSREKKQNNTAGFVLLTSILNSTLYVKRIAMFISLPSRWTIMKVLMIHTQINGSSWRNVNNNIAKLI